MKRVLLGIISIVIVMCLCSCGIDNTDLVEKSQNQQQEIIISGENVELKNESVDSQNGKLDVELVKSYTDIINTAEAEKLSENFRYDLVYFNDDDVPDLVVGKPGYWVSLYLYDDGEIYNIVESWGYGAAGNVGYDYEEKSGVIINSNTDFAGAIVTVSTKILNSNFEFETFSVTSAGAEIPQNDLRYQDIIDALDSYGGFYYNGEKISEEEYTNKINKYLPNGITGITKMLVGSKTAEELKNELVNASINF